MKIGVFTAVFGQQTLEQTLDYIAESGLEAVEFPTGNYSECCHIFPDQLIDNTSAQKDLLKAVETRGLTISALSCHGNPLHPNKEIAKEHHETHRKSVILAEQLGVEVVVTFSGCPGDGPDAKAPNWVTCAWPPDFSDLAKWQWDEVMIPYWKEEAKFAEAHKVKYAFEPHPGFCVYNVETMLRIHEICGDAIGCNFDPSHMFWNGVDACAAIRALGDVIYYVHAKDCRVDPYNTAVNGCNDYKPYGDVLERSWVFRTVGYGHNAQIWNDIISTLKAIGYDSVISIEHEDSLMSATEGFQKAVSFLKEAVIKEQAGGMWWL